jgi:hypothetical protein
MRKWLATPPLKILKTLKTGSHATGGRGFEGFEDFEEPSRKLKFDPDALEERAALVQYEASVPRGWAEGFARLDRSMPPESFSVTRWQQIIDDGGRFLDRWSSTADALGWDPASVFGLKPAGLVMLIDGGDVTAIAALAATIRSPAGSVRIYRRQDAPGVVSLWELQQ